MSDIPTQVELGCGNKKPDGFYGVDIANTSTVDLVQDLNDEDWDLPSNHFQTIRAIDVFEHVKNPTTFMNELWRIAAPGCNITIRGPHFSSGNWQDPTHERLLGSRSFEHYSEETRFGFYSDHAFAVVDTEIQFQWTRTPVYKQVGYFLANRFTSLYEKTFIRNLFPATNIEFTLKPLNKPIIK